MTKGHGTGTIAEQHEEKPKILEAVIYVYTVHGHGRESSESTIQELSPGHPLMPIMGDPWHFFWAKE